MQEYNKKALEEFVSPSDIPLFDLVTANIDAIVTTTNIFGDRNDDSSTTAFILGIIKTVIDMLIGIEIDLEDFQKFLIAQKEKGG